MGHFAFANNTNRFMGVAPLKDQAFAVCGVPYDGVVTNRPGARFGPQAIRASSLMLCDAIHPVFDVSPIDFRSAWLITPIAHSLIALPLVVRTTLPVIRAVPKGLREVAARWSLAETRRSRRFLAADLLGN